MNEILMTRRRKITRFTCHGVPAKPGIAGALFTALGKKSINILHMFNTEHGEEGGDISFSVGEDSFDKTSEVLEDIKEIIGIETITVQHNLAILSFDLEETVCETVIGTMTLVESLTTPMKLPLFESSYAASLFSRMVVETFDTPGVYQTLNQLKPYKPALGTVIIFPL